MSNYFYGVIPTALLERHRMVILEMALRVLLIKVGTAARAVPRSPACKIDFELTRSSKFRTAIVSQRKIEA